MLLYINVRCCRGASFGHCNNKNSGSSSIIVIHGGQKSVHIRWVLCTRRVSYFRLVTLQLVYCNYSFEDSVAKIIYGSKFSEYEVISPTKSLDSFGVCGPGWVV